MTFEQKLTTEYSRLKHARYDLVAQRNALPKGSLQYKKRGKCTYCYLAYRDDWGDVIYQYVKPDDITVIQSKIKERKALDEKIKSTTSDLHLVEKALGRTKYNRKYIRQCVTDVMKRYPEADIRKITLFGSRATSKFRDDSDVDLIVEYGNKKPGIWKISELRIALTEALGMDVDLISADAVKDSMLEIGKTEVVYGS